MNNREQGVIITGPTGEAKIDSLRASIMGPEAATAMRHEEETKNLVPLKKLDKPVAIDRLVSILKKKQLPFTLVYLIDTPEGRHAEFVNTICHPQGADVIHATVEANRAAFWPDSVEGIVGAKGD
jgi:hypothetical protein